MTFLFLQAELHNVRSQLLSDFTPDDMCPTSTQFFEVHADNPSSGSHETGHHQEVYTSAQWHIYPSPTFHVKNIVLFSRVCWLTWGMTMMLLGKLQKAQKLPHLLYLHQIFWVLISFLKRYEKSILPCFSLVYLSLEYCHVEMALHYKLLCSPGMIILLYYIRVIYFRLVQNQHLRLEQCQQTLDSRIWLATVKPWQLGNSRKCLPSWASSKACKRQGCQAASPTKWSWTFSMSRSCLRYSTSHSQGHLFTLNNFIWNWTLLKNKILTWTSNSEQTGAHSTNPFADDSLQGYPQYMNGPDDTQPGQDFQQQTLKLPAASPYDNFLRAAGC